MKHVFRRALGAALIALAAPLGASAEPISLGRKGAWALKFSAFAFNGVDVAACLSANTTDATNFFHVERWSMVRGAYSVTIYDTDLPETEDGRLGEATLIFMEAGAETRLTTRAREVRSAGGRFNRAIRFGAPLDGAMAAALRRAETARFRYGAFESEDFALGALGETMAALDACAAERFQPRHAPLESGDIEGLE